MRVFGHLKHAGPDLASPVQRQGLPRFAGAVGQLGYLGI